MSAKLSYYRSESGVKTVLYDPDRGRKYHALLMMDGGLVVRKVPLNEERYMTECNEAKKRRNLNGAFRVFAAYGRNVGATKEAKRLLKELRS